jgi:hypothetical protein
MWFKRILGFDKPLMGRKRFFLNYFVAFVVAVVGRLFSNTGVSFGNEGNNVGAFVFLAIAFCAVVLLFCIYVPSLLRRSRDAGVFKVWWLGLIPLFNFLFAIFLIFKGPSPATKSSV